MGEGGLGRTVIFPEVGEPAPRGPLAPPREELIAPRGRSALRGARYFPEESDLIGFESRISLWLPSQSLS